MEIREISVNMTYTKNLGNYENIKMDAGIIITLGQGDDLEQAYARGWEIAKQQVRAQIPARGAAPV